MQDIYKVTTNPKAEVENMVTGEYYRITVLTEGLLRLEYSEDGVFEDRPTQMAFFRDFPPADYRIIRKEDGIEIHTKRLQLIYNEKEFSGFGLSVQVKGNLSAYHSIWHYGEAINDLGGTARTLDEADGAVDLDHGVVSRFGYSVLDDSRSQVLLEDGWLKPRKKGIKDLYFFGYGHDYKEALRDFYHLAGRTPMLPRYALGNWWSRFYPYSEETYLELMERFEKENLPFSVAVIDMDWHLTDIDPKYGSGWTGYTWNRELFPDPAGFLKKLHDKGMKITLNVHPAEGVKEHEEMYKTMARAMGVDYEKGDPVNCDPADPKYIEAYFQYLHHPREEEGVDFWWIDWQQGGNCKVEGLDPLWIFNHFHFLDNKRNGKRPMTFSRYAGPGSHRYPIGFSGDTLITWKSLDFQPYFTAAASNIGYGWWSHDIGGHMMGYKDDEMTARWVQFGIFSPIMRLHSSSSPFNGKEPWRYKKETEMVMGDALRKRHEMIPYLYTMNYRCYAENLPLILPMYYQYPEESQAYQVKNQYLFGSELLVAPITCKRLPGINMAPVKTWLPEGLWYDIYSGMMYEGGRSLTMYRRLESIPVLAKAGAILPFTNEITAKQAGLNPYSLTVKTYAGADGAFCLYEDDNETCDYERGICVFTRMEYKEHREEKQAVFTICPAEGSLSLIPEKRSWTLEFAGYERKAADSLQVLADGRPLPVSVRYDFRFQSVIAKLPKLPADVKIQVFINMDLQAKENHREEACFEFLNQAEIEFNLKDKIYRSLTDGGQGIKADRIPVLLGELAAMELDRDLYGALTEILTARN